MHYLWKLDCLPELFEILHIILSYYIIIVFHSTLDSLSSKGLRI